jgi:hypothetical protein
MQTLRKMKYFWNEEFGTMNSVTISYKKCKEEFGDVLILLLH